MALEAKFASQVEQLRTGMAGTPSMDGFVFSVDPLFQLEPGIRWFLQVCDTLTIAQVPVIRRSITSYDEGHHLLLSLTDLVR